MKGRRRRRRRNRSVSDGEDAALAVAKISNSPGATEQNKKKIAKRERERERERVNKSIHKQVHMCTNKRTFAQVNKSSLKSTSAVASPPSLSDMLFIFVIGRFL